MRKLAIKIIQELQSGQGLYRDDFPESMKGSMAANFWDKGEFVLGMEYGYILALMKTFNITEEEIMGTK